MKSEIFSPTESKVLKYVNEKKTTIKKIADKFFKDEKKPLNPNSVISGAILQINKKCDYHKLDWKLEGEGLGRGGKTVWLTKK